MTRGFDAARYYVIRASNGFVVQVRRGTDAPVIKAGGARYTTVQRPRRMSMIQWDGDDPWQMDVPVMFDGWIDGFNVERDIQMVNDLAKAPGAWVAPATIQIDGGLPAKGGTWIITGIDYGTEVIWDTDRYNYPFRYRQDAVLHLLQYIPETVLQMLRKPGTTTPYYVKHGDTLAEIAQKWYVTPQSIMKKNKIRDQKSIKFGQLLLIPPSMFGPLPSSLPGAFSNSKSFQNPGLPEQKRKTKIKYKY